MVTHPNKIPVILISKDDVPNALRIEPFPHPTSATHSHGHARVSVTAVTGGSPGLQAQSPSLLYQMPETSVILVQQPVPSHQHTQGTGTKNISGLSLHHTAKPSSALKANICV